MTEKRKAVPGDKVSWDAVITQTGRTRRRFGTVVETTADRIAVIRTEKHGNLVRVHLDKLRREN